MSMCYEVLLSSRLSLKHLFDDDDGEPKTLGETQLQKHIGMSLSTQSQWKWANWIDALGLQMYTQGKSYYWR